MRAFCPPKNEPEKDIVMTPEYLAKDIIGHFNPTGIILDPSRGTGAFYDNFPSDTKDWCELGEGKDFLTYTQKVDWIITNPPYSIFDDFLDKAFEVADNVVFFVPFSKLFKSKGNDQAVMKYGDVKEIINLGTGNTHGFPVGFLVGAIHYQRNYKGDIKFSRNY